MRPSLFLAVVLVVPLAACANTSGAVNLINAVETNLNHCHHTVTYSASVGALNPGSGATVQGNIDCPAASPAPTTPATPTPLTPAP